MRERAGKKGRKGNIISVEEKGGGKQKVERSLSLKR